MHCYYDSQQLLIMIRCLVDFAILVPVTNPNIDASLIGRECLCFHRAPPSASPPRISSIDVNGIL